MASRPDTDSGAIRALEARIEADPGNIDARRELARRRYRAGDRAGAVAETLNVGRILMHEHRYADAMQLCREALAVLPENTEARVLLAQLHARMPELQTGPRVAVPTGAHETVIELGPERRVDPARRNETVTGRPRSADSGPVPSERLELSSGSLIAISDDSGASAPIERATPGPSREQQTSGDFEVVEEHILPPPPPAPPRRATSRSEQPTPVVAPLAITDEESVVLAPDLAAAAPPATDTSLADHRRSALNPFLDDPDTVESGRRSLGPAEVHLSVEDLPACPFVAGLSAPARHRLLEHLEFVAYTDGEPIVHAERPLDRLVLLYDGVAAVDTATGGDRFAVGQWIGAFDALASVAPTATAVAEGPTRTLELRRERFATLARNDQELGNAFNGLLRETVVRQLLSRAPLFQSLTREQRDGLASEFFALDVEPGEVVLKQGGINRRLFVLLDGQLAIDSRGAERPFGRMALEPGDFFGFVSTVLGRAVQVAVEATEPSRLLVLSEQEVYRLVAANKGIARAARREAVERGDAPISVHRVAGLGGFVVRRPSY